MDLSAPEIRVLGCLLEKQRTTPDAYPLSLNALRLACNQATNRDPVTEYDEAVIRDALHRLSRRRWARLASGAGSRAPKYRHLLDEALELPEDELGVLCVLMLRGAQTPGELKQRTERLHPIPDLPAVLDALKRLIGRELAERLPRRPGQKEERYTHLLGDDEPQAGAPAPAAPAAPGPPPDVADIEDAPAPPAAAVAPAAAPAPDPRVARLEDEVAALRSDLEALRASLDAQRAELGA
ncbi:MAG: YceH family protein [Solirubrobacteraceae bacterium]